MIWNPREGAEGSRYGAVVWEAEYGTGRQSCWCIWGLVRWILCRYKKKTNQESSVSFWKLLQWYYLIYSAMKSLGFQSVWEQMEGSYNKSWRRRGGQAEIGRTNYGNWRLVKCIWCDHNVTGESDSWKGRWVQFWVLYLEIALVPGQVVIKKNQFHSVSWECS